MYHITTLTTQNRSSSGFTANMSMERMIAIASTIVLVLLFELSSSSLTNTHAGRCALLVFCSAIVSHFSWSSVEIWRECRSQRAKRVPEVQPTTSFTSTLSSPSLDNLHPDEECPLCKRKFRDPAEDLLPLYLPCGHLWCEACIEDYIVVQRSVEDCPLCRQKIRQKLQTLRAKIVRLQMAFADTVCTNAVLLAIFTWLVVLVLFMPFYQLNKILTAILDRGPGFLLISYVAGRNNCALFLFRGAIEVTACLKPEGCGIVATLQRIVVPLFYLRRDYQTLKIVFEHAVMPSQLVGPQGVHPPSAIATALTWIGYAAVVLSFWDERKFIENLPVNCQLWCKLAWDILL